MKYRTALPKLTALQIFGIVLALIGLSLLLFSGLSAYRLVTSEPDLSPDVYQNELDAGIAPDIVESEILLTNRKKAAARLPVAVIGGILVIGSAALFFTSYADGTELHLWSRRNAGQNEPETLIDEGYSTPDDGFDYIIDPDLRARLIREQKQRQSPQNRR